MAKSNDNEFIINDKQLAMKELCSEFGTISCLTDDDLFDALEKSIKEREFDFELIRLNKKFINMLKDFGKNQNTINGQVQKIFNFIKNFLDKNPDYPRTDYLHLEIMVLGMFLKKGYKNTNKNYINEIEFSALDDLILSLSKIEECNSVSTYISYINDCKETLYLKIAKQVRKEDQEGMIDTIVDLVSDTKIFNYTKRAVSLSYVGEEHQPNLAEQILIDSITNLEEGQNIYKLIVENVKNSKIEEVRKVI